MYYVPALPGYVTYYLHYPMVGMFLEVSFNLKISTALYGGLCRVPTTVPLPMQCIV